MGLPETSLSSRIFDLHTHGLAGFDTQSDDPAAMLAVARMHGRAGVSEVLLSLYSAPLGVMRGRMAAVKAAMAGQGGEEGARIVGVHLEGPFLNPARCGALDPSSFVAPSEAAWHELTEGYEEIVRAVTVAPEMEGACRLIRRISGSGVRVSMGHSEATYAEAEAAFRAGARGITHLFNAMRGLHHREPGIAGFGLLHPGIYVEIIGDLAHLDRNAVDLVLRLKDPKRVILVSDSVAATALSGGMPPREGGMLTGGALPLPAAALRLIEAGFDEERIVAAMTANPRAYLEG
jgi:N-acetylglucosamine-6-phosphate deacetylase